MQLPTAMEIHANRAVARTEAPTLPAKNSGVRASRAGLPGGNPGDGGRSSTAAQGRLVPLPAESPAPPDNPSTPERVALGRLLFWDPILSGQKDVACATCHHPAFGYSDGLDLSIGANGAGLGPLETFLPDHAPRPVKRNSQTVLNAAFNGLTADGDSNPAVAPMFWDLRVRSLEAQALEPLKALDEMRGGDVSRGSVLLLPSSRD